jgi:hypothetical protein
MRAQWSDNEASILNDEGRATLKFCVFDVVAPMVRGPGDAGVAAVDWPQGRAAYMASMMGLLQRGMR